MRNFAVKKVGYLCLQLGKEMFLSFSPPSVTVLELRVNFGIGFKQQEAESQYEYDPVVMIPAIFILN